MPRIALFLSDTIQEAGIRAILERYFTTTDVESFADPGAMLCETTGGHFDNYVTDSATFAANVDFFLPRRNQCIVLTAGTCPPATTGNDTPHTVGTADTLENLLEAIGRALTPALLSPESTSDELSTREIQVLQLVVSGAINKEIADRLNISLNTVLTHRKNITAKLGIKTISGLTLYALMHGYISTDTLT